MVLPIFIAQSVEKFRRRIGHTGIAQRPDVREVADDLRKGCEPALRMVHRTLAAHFPNLTRQREALEDVSLAALERELEERQRAVLGTLSVEQLQRALEERRARE